MRMGLRFSLALAVIMAGALGAVAQDVGKVAKETGHATAKAAEATSRGTTKAVAKTSSATGSAVKKSAHGVKHGVKDVGHELKGDENSKTEAQK